MSLPTEIKTGETLAVVVEVEKKKQKIYWTEDTEAAVKEYLSLDFDHLSSKLDLYLKNQVELGKYDPTIDDGYIAELKVRIEKSASDKTQAKKEIIFRTRIRTPLNRLIENIIFSFKLFRYDIDVKTLHNDCMSHVYEKFYKFDPDQNTKSFSYFGTIAKHYLQNKKKDLDMLKSINLNYDDYRDEVDDRENYEIDTEGSDASSELIELFGFMTKMFEKNMANKALNDNDKKVLEAILALFKSHEAERKGETTIEVDEPIMKGKPHSLYKEKYDRYGKEKTRKVSVIKPSSSNLSEPIDKSLIDDNRYNKGTILDFISDRSKLSKEDMSKSLTKLRNLYKEKKKDFYNDRDKH